MEKRISSGDSLRQEAISSPDEALSLKAAFDQPDTAGGAAAGEPEFFRDKANWISYLLIGHYCFLLASLGPIMPFLREEEHLNYFLSALHFTAWSTGSFVAGAVGHMIMRRLGYVKTVWVCGFSVLITSLVLAAVANPFITIGIAFLGGLGGSAMGQSVTTLMAERYGTKRGIYITEANISGSVFAMLAPLAVGSFLSWGLGWRAVLIIPMILFLFAFATSRHVYAQIKQTARSMEGGALPLRYWLFYVLIWFSVASEWSIIFWTSEFLEKVKGFDKVDAAQSVSIFLVSMLIGRILGIRLVRSFDANLLLLVTAIIAFFGLFTFWQGGSNVVSLVGLFFAGLGTANIYPTSFAQAIGSSHGKTSLAASRMSTSTGSAVLITPLILGAIGDRFGIFIGYGLLAVFMAMTIVVAIVALIMRPKEK